MRIEPTVKDAIDGYLRWKPRGASLSEIYEAVERRVDRVARPSIRRTLHSNLDGPDARYVRVRRGVYALTEFGRANERGQAG